MPESRTRPGHHEYQKPADIPASQRSKGRTLWAVLLSVFGLLIAYFTLGDNYVTLLIFGAIGGLVGYFIGKRMERV